MFQRYFCVLAVGVARSRLRGGLHGARLHLARRVISLALLGDERRNRDRGEKADDQDDNHELDEGKTTLTLRALAQSIQHLNLLGSSRWPALGHRPSGDASPSRESPALLRTR